MSTKAPHKADRAYSSRNAEDKPYDRSDLDRMTCSTAGCKCGASGGLIFRARCHLDAVPLTVYSHGVIRIECSVCRRPVVDIQVAGVAPPDGAGADA